MHSYRPDTPLTSAFSLPHSRDSPGSSIQEYSVARDDPSSASSSGSIDKNDIVIAYVFLRLCVFSLDTILSIRVMGPTGAGKSSVSRLVRDFLLRWDWDIHSS